MESNQLFEFQKIASPLLSSKVRVGVRPSKSYKFQGPTSKEVEIGSSSMCSMGGDALEHAKRYKGIVLAQLEDVEHLTYKQPDSKINVDEYPNSAVGVIRILSVNGSVCGMGTGSLIGPNLVLTVAHNCFNMFFGFQMNVEFVPSPIQKRRGKGFKVARKYIPSRIKEVQGKQSQNKNPKSMFDYAVLELDTEQNLEEYFGSFGYDFLQSQYKFQQTIPNMILLGYPETASGLTQYNGQVYVDKNYFLLNMPLQKGVSGSPVFCKDDKDYKIVAIHAKNLQKIIKGFYGSLRLTSNMIEDIQENFKSPKNNSPLNSFEPQRKKIAEDQASFKNRMENINLSKTQQNNNQNNQKFTQNVAKFQEGSLKLPNTPGDYKAKPYK